MPQGRQTSGEVLFFYLYLMSLLRYLCGILLVLSVGTLSTGTAAGADGAEMYRGVVNFGTQLVPWANTCLWVDGTVAAADFFDGLERRRNGSSPEYRKGSEVLTEYPDLVTVSIRFLNQCAAALPNWQFADFGKVAQLLTFEASWKAGLQLTPAAQPAPGSQCAASADSVTCRISISSKGVPLGDHLIISVFSPDGTRLTRLSAAP